MDNDLSYIEETSLLWPILRTLREEYNGLNMVHDDFEPIVAVTCIEGMEGTFEWGLHEDEKLEYCPFSVYMNGGIDDGMVSCCFISY